MYRRSRLHLLGPALALAFVFALSAAGAAPAQPPGSSPAATLLLPYFEVDPSGPEALTTLFSVNNAGTEPVVAHVVLWTDWGVPTYSFDLVLEANDVQTVNLRDLFLGGSVPETDGTHVPGCASPVVVPPLDAAALRARHSGQPDPEDGLCYGGEQEGGRFVGYVTVDTARTCIGEEVYAPPDDGYFFSNFGGVPPAPFATGENVLWGDLFYVAGDEDSAQGVELVHVPFVPEAPAGETFYRLHAPDGQDGRAMLGSRYRGRYLDGGPFDGGTELLVWLEDSFAGEPLECGTRGGAIDSCQGADIRLFDEEGVLAGGGSIGPERLSLRLPVGGETLPTLAPFGMFELDHLVVFGCVIIPIGSEPRQAWVTPVMHAEGRFSVGMPATRIPVPE